MVRKGFPDRRDADQQADSELQIVDLDSDGGPSETSWSFHHQQRSSLLQGQRLAPRVRLGMGVLIVTCILTLGVLVLVNIYQASILARHATVVKVSQPHYMNDDYYQPIQSTENIVIFIDYFQFLNVIVKHTGKLVWRHHTVDGNYVLDKQSGIIYVKNIDARRQFDWVALRAQDGAELHDYHVVGGSSSLLAVQDGLLYFLVVDQDQASGSSTDSDEIRTLEVVRATDGELVWQRQDVVDCLLKQETLYVVIEAKQYDGVNSWKTRIDLHMEALRAKDGSRLWSHENVNRIVAAQDSMLVVTFSNEIGALQVEDGKPLWSEEVGFLSEANVIGETIYAYQWVMGDTYSASLTGFDLRTGHRLWNVNGQVDSMTFMESEDQVFVTELDQGIRVFAARTGQLLWTYPGVGQNCQMLNVDEHNAYALCQDKRSVPQENTVIALEKNRGQLVWQKTVPDRFASVSGGVLYSNIQADGLSALRLDDGALLWRYWSPIFQ